MSQIKTGSTSITVLALLCLLIPAVVSAQDRRTFAEAVAAEAKALQENQTAESRRSAIKKYEEALAVWNELGDKQKAATVLNDIGSIYRELGDAPRALEHFDRSLILAKDSKDKSLEATVMLFQGQAYDLLGNTRRQLELYEQALTLARESKDQKTELFALGSLGFVHYRLGDYQRAIDYNNQSLPLFRLLNDKEGEAIILVNTGAIYQALGKTRESIDNFLQGLAIMRERKLTQSEAVILNNIGVGYSDLGEYRKSTEFHDQALALRRKTGDRRGEAVSLGSLAGSYMLLGELPKALDLFKQSLAIHRELKARRSEGNTLSNMGRIYSDLRQFDLAFENYSLALPIRSETGDRDGESITLLGIAFVERKRGNLIEARSHVEKAIRIVESTRTSLASQDLRSSYFALSQDIYRLHIDILMDLDSKEPNRGYDALALQASENARSRGLLDSLAEARANIRQGADAALLDRERSLQKQLAAKDAERQRASTKEQREALDTDLRSVAIQYQDLLAEMRQRSPRYAALTQPHRLSLEEIQQLLDPGSVLLEYSLGDKTSYLWVVSQTTIRTVRLPNRTDIEALAKSFYDSLRNLRASADSQKNAAQLGKILLEPVIAELGGKRLLIVADGVLNYIPFSALTTSRSNDSLILTNEIVYLPSASTLGVLRTDANSRRLAPKTLAVFADPVFDARDTRVGRPPTAAPEVSSADSALRRATRNAGITNSLPRLPATRREAAAILSLLPESDRMRAVDFEANLAAVTTGQLSQYRIIHFATHGLLNSVHPELSGIVLSLVDAKGKPQDGFLRLSEIYNLSLPAELVVLSACQTALGKDVKGEGLVGLTRGFMYAGAPRVVASLWTVDDQATSELMRRFYEGMLGEKKMRPAAALRNAQIAMIKTKRFNAPYYWSAFTIQGEWK